MDGLLCHNNSTKIQQQSIESKTSTSQISELSFNKIQVHEKEIFKTDGLQSMNSSSQIQQQSTELKSSTSKISELSFDKLQIDEKEMCKGLKRAFGRFIAREVAVDEEYWVSSCFSNLNDSLLNSTFLSLKSLLNLNRQLRGCGQKPIGSLCHT